MSSPELCSRTFQFHQRCIFIRRFFTHVGSSDSFVKIASRCELHRHKVIRHKVIQHLCELRSAMSRRRRKSVSVTRSHKGSVKKGFHEPPVLCLVGESTLLPRARIQKSCSRTLISFSRIQKGKTHRHFERQRGFVEEEEEGILAGEE